MICPAVRASGSAPYSSADLLLHARALETRPVGQRELDVLDDLEAEGRAEEQKITLRVDTRRQEFG